MLRKGGKGEEKKDKPEAGNRLQSTMSAEAAGHAYIEFQRIMQSDWQSNFSQSFSKRIRDGWDV